MRAGSVLDLKWLISLGRKIATVVLWKTILIVCLTLVSQISAILASFLPLKVIILLGSDGIPRYIPEALALYGKDTLIVSFSLLTAGLFLIHLMTESIISKVTNSAKNDLLKKSRKIVLFENQDEIASGAYLRFSRALSGGVLFLSGFIALLLVYPDMVLIISTYVMVSVFFFFFRIRNSDEFSLKFEEKFSNLLRLTASLGFFVGFGYLILDFTVFSPPGIIVAIISILLSRIMLQKVSSAIIDAVFLTQKRSKLQPLFFHGSALSRPTKKNREGEGIWSLIGKDIKTVIDFIFTEYFESWNGCESVCWIQTGVRDVAGFEVVEKSGDKFFVKIYDRRRESLAIHEATLVSEKLPHLPAPELLAVTEFNQLKCLIYGFVEGRRPEFEELRQMPENVRGRLMWVEPVDSIIRTFVRSKPLLADRLDRSLIEKLRICAVGMQQQNVDFLEKHFIQLQDYLRRLPLMIVLPDISPSSVVYAALDNDILILNWGRWELDTVGSGWRTRPKRIARLGPSLVDAQQKRSDLIGVSTEDVELVAFVSALETKCSKQLFADALDFLPEILVRMKNIEGVCEECQASVTGENIG